MVDFAVNRPVQASNYDSKHYNDSLSGSFKYSNAFFNPKHTGIKSSPPLPNIFATPIDINQK